EALYLLGQTGEARGQRDAAALAYRELRIVAPASGWADGAEDRLAALASAGVQVPPLSLLQRLERAGRLLRGGGPPWPRTAGETIAGEASDVGVALRALRIVADGAQRIGRYEIAARAIDMALKRAPEDKRAGLQLDRGRVLWRAGDREKDKAKARALKDKSLA